MGRFQASFIKKSLISFFLGLRPFQIHVLDFCCHLSRPDPCDCLGCNFSHYCCDPNFANPFACTHLDRNPYLCLFSGYRLYPYPIHPYFYLGIHPFLG
ncbi:hypothetical protein AYI68_g791 [Smittium mucronatum]|uniref:Uncharacterized protein n=1 Tax=Smittium mucronatum TaxID=133383 RepID=A0A1R0H7D1_9FUNG|nr:hypothetical protein AYI68_g791 [Smittium mucronatum]